jgi:DNA polymerase II small subunit/DNA polymerase delta subunit B
MSNVASTVGRASAILTASEVKGTTLDMQNTADGRVTVDLSFTKGSLTNVIVTFYGSVDDVTWDPITSVNGATLGAETITEDAERMYAIDLPGVRYFTVGVVGTGTATSSLCAFTYRYNRSYLTSTQTDGVLRLS